MLDRIGRAVHRSRNLSIQQLLRLQYPVGNPFWLANACMNRVSRAIAARARICLLAELHRDKVLFRDRFVPALLPKRLLHRI